MSKYFDRLVEINESLRKQLNEEEEETVTVPADSITPEQKDRMLQDKMEELDVDPKAVDIKIMDDDEKDTAMNVLSNIKTESIEDGEFVVYMNDADLGLDGYIPLDEADELSDVDYAHRYATEEDAEEAIAEYCEKYNYDPETFSVQSMFSPTEGGIDIPDNEVMIDDTEAWVSLDPLEPDATTLG